MTESNALPFLVGGRYLNRNGEYEVVEIRGDTLRVVYDDGTTADLNARMQAQIAQAMRRGARAVEPYSGGAMDNRNRSFFRALGFLAVRATMLEAIVHPNAQSGFVQTYQMMTGRRPYEGQDGYYVHDPNADKWGNELRVTFAASVDECDGLEFGQGVNVVTNPSAPGTSWRINKNAFWWLLLQLGFRMGSAQDSNEIRGRIPPCYWVDYDAGVLAARD